LDISISERKITKTKIIKKNKVVLITGGVSGIGRLLALECKKLGAKVIVWDVNEDGVEEMKKNVDLSIKCNVADKKAVADGSKQVLDTFKTVHILVNNAGIVSGKPLLDLSEEQIRRTFDVNVISHFWTLQAFLPAMLDAQEGHIVTIASTAGRSGVSQLTDYCASKYACIGLQEAVHRELLTHNFKNIKFSCICPFFINTGMFTGAKDSRFWWLRYFAYILEPEYVANEILKAIQYEKREIILPYRLGHLYSMEHILPDWLKDFLIVNGSNMSGFIGRQSH